MTVSLLSTSESTALRGASFTYDAVGTVSEAAEAAAPEGFERVSRSQTLGRHDFAAAANDLLTWRVHDRAGLRVSASEIPLVAGTVTVMRLGIGPASVSIPCRVVAVVDEARRRGFSYGTLPGHPESGEEQFVLEQRADGRIDFTITAFSRPATVLARLAGPAGRAGQRFMTQRYLDALDRL